MINNIIKNNSGVAAIITVLIISAVVLTMAKSISFLGINELDISFLGNKSQQTLALAEGCAEEALRQLQIDENYIVSGKELSVGSGSCTISVSTEASEKIIMINAVEGDYYKNLEIKININNGNIDIENWEEVDNL